MCWLCVQSHNVVIPFAPSGQKGLFSLFGYLFQGFQAIGRKSGADDIQPFDTRMRQLFEGLVGIGLQPGFTPKARLESQTPLFGAEPQVLRHQLGRCLTLQRIGIPSLGIALRNAMKREE